MLKVVLVRLSVVAFACCLAITAHAMADQKSHVSVPAGDLTIGLETLAKQTGAEFVYSTDQVRGLHTRGVSGDLSAQEAVTKLLIGTSLELRMDSTGAMLIAPALQQAQVNDQAAQNSEQKEGKKSSSGDFRMAQVDQASAGPQMSDDKKERKRAPEELEEIVVTGTHIRGAETVSPVLTITGQDMTELGYTDLDQVFAQLPQNFSGGVSRASNPQLAAGGDAPLNGTYATGVNLRGLGPGATLVLLNGQRLAPSSQGSSVDISGIPVSAIDRVEILTDGASAIYGSDAVAGVVNIITKHDYSGVETGARAYSIASGKSMDYGGYVLLGSKWQSGNFVVDVDGERNNPLFARDREFTQTLPDPLELLNAQSTGSLTATLQQRLTDRLLFASNVFFSYRDFTNEQTNATFGGQGVFKVEGSSRQPAVSLSLEYTLSPDWTADVSGLVSQQRDLIKTGSDGTTDQNLTYDIFKTSEIDLGINGKLYNLPGGAIRGALGAQVRTESLDTTTGTFPTINEASLGRTVDSAYAELSVPIFGQTNAVTLIRDLRLDIAGRFDHYNDFGSTTNPKFGVAWKPIDDVTIHASYAKSFKAPLLVQLGDGNPPTGLVAFIPDPKSATGQTATLFEGGGNSALTPERSTSVAAGLTIKPVGVPGFSTDISFFDIDYKDKIVNLFTSGIAADALVDEDILGSLITRNPSVAQVNSVIASLTPPILDLLFLGRPFTAADIHAIADMRYQNVGVAKIQGVDAQLRYERDVSFGRVYGDLSGQMFTSYSQQLTPESTEFSTLNQLYQPLKFRAKADLGMSRGPFAAYGRINFANSYHNNNDPNCPVTPGCDVSSWATVDAGFSYDSGRISVGGSAPGLRVSLDVVNIANREPPHINPGGIAFLTYDPLNANPLQRAFGVSIITRW